MALNQVQGYNLYIGGVLALRNKAALHAANITHVVSVLRMKPDEHLTDPFENLKIEVDDVEDEDLLQHFQESNAFIQSALDKGASVLIHCAMGKSRSVAVCIAYLMNRQPKGLNPDTTLKLIRKSRPIAEPNEGFMNQLWLYHEMGCPDDVVNHPSYIRWLSNRQIELSTACGKAPEMNVVRFEDELPSRESASDERPIEVRCRKCRRMLATAPFINPHAKEDVLASKSNTSRDLDCAHIFLHPLTWMRPSLFPGSASEKTPANSPSPDADAPLSGRLVCPNPKCEANVGKFAWQGLQCSCGKWVVPAIGVARARVDIVDKSVAKTTSTAATDNAKLGGMGIRLPPHMRAAESQRNNL
ncbi:dual specificity phosphatase [Talaromyces proteolyticus]|uniref:protein-tyrosine-phosphatase n=1 Tax=Talaromyces proteolyticus TaxID=1131652 RepID=A0AAD4KQP5_9EURO|nr:dual specificity phosphatase [Talaromyces proteolyticus]KAH8697219.1 dual specificity phosphatase [Talaromyces proteolyticus]